MRFHRKPRTWKVLYSQSRDGAGQCQKVELERDTKDTQGKREKDPIECNDTGKIEQARIKADIVNRSSGWALSLGGRFLTRSSGEEGGTDSKGIAGEASLQYSLWTDESASIGNLLDFSIFASFSGFHLGRAEDMLGTSTVIFPDYNTWRVTVGAELFSNVKVNDSPLLPRVGAYATFSRNYWGNEFGATEGEIENVRGNEYQAAIYMSGHFLGGFSGMVSFGMLKPYGRDEPMQYIISLTPSVGASTSKKKEIGNDP